MAVECFLSPAASHLAQSRYVLRTHPVGTCPSFEVLGLAAEPGKQLRFQDYD